MRNGELVALEEEATIVVVAENVMTDDLAAIVDASEINRRIKPELDAKGSVQTLVMQSRPCWRGWTITLHL